MVIVQDAQVAETKQSISSNIYNGIRAFFLWSL